MFPKIYPSIKNSIHLDVSAKGSFPNAGPIGVTLHYVASRDLFGSVDFFASIKVGYHLIVDRDGSVYQMTSMDQMCPHAGKADWRGYSPNERFLSVSLVSWGLLKVRENGKKFLSCKGIEICSSEVAFRPDNVLEELQYWDAATNPQLESLFQILDFCIRNGIDPEMICGHDECAAPKGRKVDPGGILPFSMAEMRLKLREKYRNISHSENDVLLRNKPQSEATG